MKVAEGDSKSDIISEFMKQYYGGTPFIPNIIMVQYEIEDADTIAQWLSARKSRKVSIVTPKKGDKEKMVELAYKNAQLVLTQDAEKIKREESRTTGAMKEIAGWLGLGTLTEQRLTIYLIQMALKVLAQWSFLRMENQRRMIIASSG